MELSYQTLKLTQQAREAVRTVIPNKQSPGLYQELLLQQAESRVSVAMATEAAAQVAQAPGPKFPS